jgi:uncharacterized alpha-E superfamily protein
MVRQRRAAERRAMRPSRCSVPTLRTSTRWSSSVERAREGARTVRDVISAEMWEAINGFHLGLGEAAVGVTGYGGPYSFVSYVKSRAALFWGVAARTMLRDEAYSFLDAGGRFEVADMVLRMLRVALPAPGESSDEHVFSLRDGQALALLQAVGGLQAYRRASASAPSASAVASFLLFTQSYPDSVAASISAVRDDLMLADASAHLRAGAAPVACPRRPRFPRARRRGPSRPARGLRDRRRRARACRQSTSLSATLVASHPSGADDDA